MRPLPAANGTTTSGDSGKRFVSLNVGGHRFLTTAATLAAAEGSYFAKLAQQGQGSSGGRGGPAEFFIDRSGKVRGRGAGRGWEEQGGR